MKSIFRWNHFNSNALQKTNAVSNAVFLGVVDLLNISKINQPLCAGDAGEVCYEDYFFDASGGVAVDDRVFFAVKAAAISWLVPVARIRKSARISIVTDRQNFSKISGRNDRPDRESETCGPL